MTTKGKILLYDGGIGGGPIETNQEILKRELTTYDFDVHTGYPCHSLRAIPGTVPEDLNPDLIFMGLYDNLWDSVWAGNCLDIVGFRKEIRTVLAHDVNALRIMRTWFPKARVLPYVSLQDHSAGEFQVELEKRVGKVEGILIKPQETTLTARIIYGLF